MADIVLKIFKNNFKTAAFAGIILLCIFSGFRYNHYQSLLPTDQMILDSKNIGQYLKTAYTQAEIFNNSSSATKPAIIFYSNRTVYALSPDILATKKQYILISQILPQPGIGSINKIYSAPSESAYLVTR
jgi:hypothetical protein